VCLLQVLIIIHLVTHIIETINLDEEEEDMGRLADDIVDIVDEVDISKNTESVKIKYLKEVLLSKPDDKFLIFCTWYVLL